MNNKNIIERIKKSNLCSGCGLCASSNISHGKVKMMYSEAGYLRPYTVEDLSNEEENLIADVCPGISVKHERIDSSYDPLWGPIVGIKTGFAVDKQIRFTGSSGGAISAILCYLLDQHEIDYVVHIGVSDHNPIQNQVKVSRNKNEVLENAGSRYAPSAPLVNIGQLLESPGKFALVGKPCDIVAMRKYAQKDKRIAEKIPYLLSFFCAGIPSIKGTYEILNRFHVSLDQVKSFRYRGNGWPGMTTITLKDGSKHEMSYNEAWGKILNKQLQFRCKICPDGTGEFADIACADAWTSDEKGFPLFTEGDGHSLIITRTEIGQKLLQKCLENNYLKVEDFDLKNLEKIQPYQSNRKKMLLSRLSALFLLRKELPVYHALGLFQLARKSSYGKQFKNFLGMTKRIMKK